MAHAWMHGCLADGHTPSGVEGCLAHGHLAALPHHTSGSRSPTGAGAAHCTAASAASAAPAPARSRGGGERGLEVGAGDVRPPSCVLMVIQASGRVVGGAARAAMLLAQASTLSLPAEIIWEISNPGGGCGSHSGSISALSPGSTQEGGTFPCGASTNQTYGV
jgi:hypothetical protein